MIEFHLTKEELKSANEWAKTHKETCPVIEVGAIGGRLSYKFTPTSIGTAVSICCACGEECNITDYSDW